MTAAASIRIDRFDLRLGPLPLPSAPSAESVARGVAEALEAGLEEALDADVDVYIEHVSVKLSVGLQANIASAVGRELARRIAATVNTVRAEGAHEHGDVRVQDAGSSVIASGRFRLGSATPARTVLPPHARSSDGTGAFTAAFPSPFEAPGSGSSAKKLGAVARAAEWGPFLATLDATTLRAWLRTLRDELTSVALPSSGGIPRRPIDDAAFVQSFSRSTRIVKHWLASAPATDSRAAGWLNGAAFLVTVGELARLGESRVLSVERVRRFLADRLDAAIGGAEAPESSERVPFDDAMPSASPPGIPSSRRPPDGRDTPAIATHESSASADADAERAGLETIVSFAEEDGSLFTEQAGAVFFVPVLLDAGLEAALSAIHGEPSLFVYEVLRRLVERLVPGAPAEAAIVWMLAGLLDAPSEDDRALDAALWIPAEVEAMALAAGDSQGAATPNDAADAWARAAIDEAEQRLGETGAATDLISAVLSLSGTVRGDDARVEVVLPFPGSYAALLRGGMVRDVPSISWLGGRSLILTFGGG